MKTINFLQDIDNRVIKPMLLKKVFEHQNFKFAIVLEPKANHKYYTLIHLESGGSLPMKLSHNKTIKDFQQKSIESINSLIERIGLKNFENILKSHPIIN